MLHFPSTLMQNGGGSSGLPRRSDSLNATQQKTPSHPLFLTIEQELHDARRVSSHGQEEDLRSALNMVINRVTEVSSLLSEAYKSKAELEVQLNVAKSNLQLVIANNEMLEEALKSGGGRDVGWRRASGASQHSNSNHHPDHRPISLDPSFAPGGTNTNNDSPTEGQSSRFFKTFFNGRPGTPTTQTQHQQQQAAHLTSPSLPSLHDEAQRERKQAEGERRAADKARAEAAAAARDKAALEAEIEQLSQALFEEANRMVATERKQRAEAENELAKLRPLTEELKKTKKAALRSALRLIEGENVELRSGSSMSGVYGHSSQSSLSLQLGESPERGMTRSRSSSEVGTKSPVRRSPEASPHPGFAGSPNMSFASSPNIPSAPSPHIPFAASPSPQPSSSSWASASASPNPNLPSSSSYISASASSSSSSSPREDDDAPISFAPTGLGVRGAPTGVGLGFGIERRVDPDATLRLEREDAEDWEDGRPTPRRAPVDLDARDAQYAHNSHSNLHLEVGDSRTSSPALSPPPTALAPSPEDPWGAA
ncbi:hypothetical protein C8R43DRAFT_924000 [Mycena crocata]|nr:hypothetical protein C8R43DRAFT_924000 [Mycena crocata]